jgi:hypothetical protein
LITDVAKNPGLLKLDLFCKGMRIDESCRIAEDGGRGIVRTRAGLGSGLEAVLPAGLHVNIPVVEDFAQRSPYVLKRVGRGYVIHHDGQPVTPVTLASLPRWYDQKTTSGKKMSQVGTLQGTYLAVYPSRVCDYWVATPHKINCKFCSVGLNLGVDDAAEKTVEDVVEVARAAKKESGITYIDFNTGHYAGDEYLDILEPIIAAVKKSTGLLIGVQTPPHHDLGRYRALRKLGVNRVSFCFEIYDKERFKEVCPGKHAQYGQKRYLDAIEYCAGIFDTTNGEIVAGLEPPESSIAAIDWMTSVGAVPTVCVFRPLKGTDLEDSTPPKTEDMIPVFRRMYEACMEHGLPIGVAPNVKVSLVLLPEEGRYLMDDPDRYLLARMRLAAMRAAFAAGFHAGLKR